MSRNLLGKDRANALVPTDTPLDNVLGILEAEGFNPRRSGSNGQWASSCPAHDDKHASLSISSGSDGKVLMHCHASCLIVDIVKALGMKMRDLFTGPPRRDATTKPALRREDRPAASPYDRTFGYVPRCISENADYICVALYAYLALCCGKDNRHQRKWERIGKAIGVSDWRTVKLHAEHLMECGWLNVYAKVNAHGGHRSVEVWLRHCPPLRILADDVRPPRRDHASREAAARRAAKSRESHQPVQVPAEEVATSVACPSTAVAASVAPPDSECGATDAPPPRYVEVMGRSVLDTSEMLDKETYGGADLEHVHSTSPCNADSDVSSEVSPCGSCCRPTVRRDYTSGEPWCLECQAEEMSL